jgi:hypothetical protein
MLIYWEEKKEGKEKRKKNCPEVNAGYVPVSRRQNHIIVVNVLKVR